MNWIQFFFCFTLGYLAGAVTCALLAASARRTHDEKMRETYRHIFDDQEARRRGEK